MHVLFATSEIAPLAKTGGLADVSRALPAALRDLGVDARVLLPAYSGVIDGLDTIEHLLTIPRRDPFPPAVLLSARLGELPVLAVECPSLYERNGTPYTDELGHEWADNPIRFGLLSRVAAMLGSADAPAGWRADVIHANDWPTGLAPALLAYAAGPRAASVFSIHNIAFQGRADPSLVEPLGLPADSYRPDGVEFYGALSFLKAGLFYADHVTTVSTAYGEELLQEPQSYGFAGLLRARGASFSGIPNGIENRVWSPESDRFLPQSYGPESLSGKEASRAELRARLGLVDGTGPVFGFVGRMAWQKGADLLAAVAPGILDRGGRIVVLGSGERHYEGKLVDLATRFPGRVTVRLGFDEALAHLITAGTDFFVMPSRYEPCGLNQMYAQAYGTPPIVARTGGLRDTVIPYAGPGSGTVGTGLVFEPGDAHQLWLAASAALDLFGDTVTYRAMQQAGMRRNFGWESRASEYAALYDGLISLPVRRAASW